MSLDDPKAWRSTLDKNTGHTYYYHKKTRVSQWVKPDCLVEEEEREAAAELQFVMHEKKTGAPVEIAPIEPTIREPARVAINMEYMDFTAYGEADDGDHLNRSFPEDDKGEEGLGAYMDDHSNRPPGTGSRYYGEFKPPADYDEYDDGASARRYEGSENAVYDDEEEEDERYAAAMAADGGDGGGDGGGSMITELVQQITLGSPKQIEEGLKLLLSCCIPTTVDAIAEEEGVLNALAGAVLQTRARVQRHLSLKCLWTLACGPRAARYAFTAEQGWAGLAQQSVWGGWDDESVVLYASLLGLLLGNPHSRRVVTAELVEVLTDRVVQIAAADTALDLDMMCDDVAAGAMAPLDSKVLLALAPGTAGLPLSGAVCVALAGACLQDPLYAVKFLEGGGLAVLQRVHGAPWSGVELRLIARRHLLTMLESSAFARETALDALLALGSSYARLPLSAGQDPLTIPGALAAVEETTEEEDAEQAFLTAQDRLDMGELSDAEFFAIEEANTIPRDVYWKPRNGCGWRVSSVLLWTRCPALRATLEKLWEEGEGGELELGTNTSALALASTVHYLHSGAFVPVSDFYGSMELVKLALELGVQDLVAASSRAVLHALQPQTAQTVLTFSRNLHLPELEEATVRYLSGDLDSDQRPSFKPVWASASTAKDDALASALAVAHNAEMILGEELLLNKAASREGAAPAHTTKPQSGGIYGMLLSEGGGGFEKVGKTQQGKVPGRLPSNQSGGGNRAAFGRAAPGKTSSGDTNKKIQRGSTIHSAADVLASMSEYTPEMSLQQQLSPKSKPSEKDAKTEKRGGANREGREEKSKELTVKEKLAERKEAREKLLARQKAREQERAAGAAGMTEEVLEATSKNITAGSGGGGGGGGGGRGGGSAGTPQLNKADSRDASPKLSASLSRSPPGTSGVPGIDANVRRSLTSLKNKARQLRTGPTDDVGHGGQGQASSQPKVSGESSPVVQRAEDIPVKRIPVASRPSLPVGACTRRVGCTCADCSESATNVPSPVAEPEYNQGPARTLGKRVVSSSASADDENADSGSNSNSPYKPSEISSMGGGGGNYLEGNDSEEEQEERDQLEGSADSMNSWDPAEAFPSGSPVELQECPECGRRFRSDIIARHVSSCKKNQRKRPVLDMRLQRLDAEALEAQNASKRNLNKSKRSSTGGGSGSRTQQEADNSKTPAWKKESVAFRDAMRNAREVTTALKDGAPLPAYQPSGPDPSLQPCPHCGRRFNSKAAERHIPKCKDIVAKPSRLTAGSGRGIGTPTSKGNGGNAARFF